MSTTKRIERIFRILIPTVMLLIFTVLIPASESVALTRLYFQDFEGTGDTWKADFQSGAWTVPEPDLIKKVTNNPHSGSYSIRGNFNANITDPITGVAGTTGSGLLHFGLNSSLANILKTQTPNEVYITYWFIFDDCKWNGTIFNRDPVTGVQGKFAYLKFNNEPYIAFFPTMMGGPHGETSLGANMGPSGGEVEVRWMAFFNEYWGTIASQTFRTESPYGTDGLWHRVEWHIRYGSPYSVMRMWIDGRLAILNEPSKPQTLREGNIPLPPDFHVEGINFWQVDQNSISLSEDRTGYCNGWQIDDIEIWDGFPKRPSLPSNLTVQ